MNMICCNSRQKKNCESFLILTLMITSYVCEQKSIFTSTILNAWQRCRYRSFMIFIHVVFEYKNNIFSYYIQDKKEKRLIFACGMIYEMQIDSCQIIDEFLFSFTKCSVDGCCRHIYSLFFT